MPFSADQALTLRGRALTDKSFRSRLLVRPKQTAAELLVYLDDKEAKDITDQAGFLNDFGQAIEAMARKLNPGGLNALTKPGVGSVGSDGGGSKIDDDASAMAELTEAINKLAGADKH